MQTCAWYGLKRVVVGIAIVLLAGCVPGAEQRRLQELAETPWPYDPVAYAAQTTGLERGAGFPLSSGIRPTLHEVGVQWVPVPQLIDVSVVLDASRRPTDTTLDELTDFGEFCLRYGTTILRRAVPADYWAQVRLLSVNYRPNANTAPVRATDLGFGFVVINGRCTLAPPYPVALIAEVQLRAGQPLADNGG